MSTMTPGGRYFANPKDKFEVFHNTEMAIADFVEQLMDKYKLTEADAVLLAKQISRLSILYHDGMKRIESGKKIIIKEGE